MDKRQGENNFPKKQHIAVEPVMEVSGPTENKDEAEQSPHTHKKLASKIGVEYTLELTESNITEPIYLCVLCDKLTRNILIHWSSFYHRLKYLQRHYPTVVRKYRPENFPNKPGKKSKLIVEVMSDAIDNFHGRLPAKSMTASEFQREKKRHTEDVINGFHYDEKFGPNFVNVVEEALLKQNNCENNYSDFDTETEQLRDFNHKSAVTKSKSPDTTLQTLHLSQERNKWEKYRFMLEESLAQIQTRQRGYDDSPETHPLYSEEWDMFWVRRFKQLKAENKVDPKTYNYKPEWVIYWTKRMNALFEAEVEKTKKGIKLSLGLPENAEETDDQRYQLQRPSCRPNDDHKPHEIRVPIGTHHSRTSSRSRSPRVRDHQLHSRTRSRSRSLTRFLSDFELPKKNYQEHNLHVQSLSRVGYNSIDKPKDDYYKHSSSRYYNSATAPTVASTSESVLTHAGSNILKPYSPSGSINQVPEQRYIDSYRESLSTAPPDRLEQYDTDLVNKRIDKREYTQRRTAYNTGDKPHADLLELGNYASTGSQNIIGEHDYGIKAYVANDHQIRTLAVIDRNVNDGGITKMNWKMLQKPLTKALVEVLRRNQGPVAQFRDAGWYQGRIKKIAFKDERSPSLFRQAIKYLGQVWRGAELDLVELSQVPNRPRAFAQIPAKPSRPRDILKLIQHSNPNLPTHNWKVVKVSFEKAGFRQASITINGECVAPLQKIDGQIRYGSQTIKLRIYREDA